MGTCDRGFDHPDPAAPVVIEEQPDLQPVADASVEIERVKADRDVQVEKIRSRGLDEETAATIAGLQARVDVLEAARIPAEPEPEPIPVALPEPEPEPDPGPPAPAAVEPDGGASEKSDGWWAGYR
jgi:hypothetical protein